MIYSLLSLMTIALITCDAAIDRRLLQGPPQLGGGAVGGAAVIPGVGGAAAGYNPYGAGAPALGVGGAPQLPGVVGGAQPVVPGVGGVGAGNGAVIPGPGFNPYANNYLMPQIDVIPQSNGGFLIDVIPQGNYNPFPNTKVDDM